jgi:formylglycine-generating enzyme required for sulfatase activity
VHYEKPYLATVNDFYIGRYEITNADWNAVMGEANNPSPIRYWWPAGGTYLDYYCGDNCTRDVGNFPMLNVSFDDVLEFIRKLNELTGKKYRLPTEAEWEYAARGGDKSMGYKYSGKNIADDVAWYSGNSSGIFNPVGGKLPNELGIYDMSGNATEYVDGFYQGYPIIRGGNVSSNAEHVKISYRSSWYRDRPSGGFRLAISAE